MAHRWQIVGNVLEAPSSILGAWLSTRTKEDGEKGRKQRGRLNRGLSTQGLEGLRRHAWFWESQENHDGS